MVIIKVTPCKICGSLVVGHPDEPLDGFACSKCGHVFREKSGLALPGKSIVRQALAHAESEMGRDNTVVDKPGSCVDLRGK